MTTRLIPILLLLVGIGCSGSGTPSPVSTPTDADSTDPLAVRPFTVQIPQPILDDLQTRLQRTRFPDEIQGSNWDYGTNLAYQRELVAYWIDAFDWREQERQINAFDHFTTTIDDLDIHFIHQRSPVEDATPLLI
ncbi:MAG: epoxide hydrolase N-terminal domain-containing protein, partial [Vicinamibacterales bacterium]|nr:epoxide hydrolase N-terminal domain-containing protein [Vicinamibacterales bacterium]